MSKKYEITTPAAEYAKHCACMLIGAAVLAFALFTFLVSKNCFVSQEDALAKRISNEEIAWQMVMPQDEFEYQWEQVYK